MRAKTLDGKCLAEQLKSKIRSKVLCLKKRDINPCLAVLLVGDDPASQVYVNRKQKSCQEVGILTKTIRLPSKSSSNDVLELIDGFNEDKNVHGILVQLPLPMQIDRYSVLNRVNPRKDVDGFHISNMGALMHSRPQILPCTPSGIMHLFSMYKLPLNGQHCVIINDTIIIGRPLCHLMLDRGATVSVCHSRTINLKAFTREADIVVSAVGKRPNFSLCADMVKPGAIVIDVGINRVDGKIVGDVELDVWDTASWVTPVPGSIGPLTVGFLLNNTVLAAKYLCC